MEYMDRGEQMFPHLTEAQIGRISSIGKRRDVRAGEVLIEVGEQNTCLFLVMAGAIRLWLVGHTAVAARDSIGYIRYALELENKPWAEVIRSNEQHPAYPTALLLMSWPVRHWMHDINPHSMQLSAQLATALAAILLVFPLYFLGCELYSPRVAFWGAALFQCLPATARATADDPRRAA